MKPHMCAPRKSFTYVSSADEAFDHHNNSLLDVPVQKVEDQSMALSWVTSDAPGAAYFVRWREITSSRYNSFLSFIISCR